MWKLGDILELYIMVAGAYPAVPLDHIRMCKMQSIQRTSIALVFRPVGTSSVAVPLMEKSKCGFFKAQLIVPNTFCFQRTASRKSV